MKRTREPHNLHSQKLCRDREREHCCTHYTCGIDFNMPIKSLVLPSNLFMAFKCHKLFMFWSSYCCCHRCCCLHLIRFPSFQQKTMNKKIFAYHSDVCLCKFFEFILSFSEELIVCNFALSINMFDWEFFHWKENQIATRK